MDDNSRKRTDDNRGRKHGENVKKAEVAVSRPLPTPAPLDLRMFDDVSYVPPKIVYGLRCSALVCCLVYADQRCTLSSVGIAGCSTAVLH